MTIDFKSLPHEGIRSLVPYKPGTSIEEVKRTKKIKDIIKMASNENPLGCSPLALSALHQMSAQAAATYPSPINHPLMPKLAQKHKLSTDQLFLSNGSDNIFSMLLYCFALHTNKHIITHEYSFSTFAIQAQTLHIPVHTIADNPDWTVNIDKITQACTKNTGLIFLANPNNPTGILISQDEIHFLLDNIPKSTILVLDEAYYEFATSSLRPHSIAWLDQYPNLVITRTFSKIYGMAGLRLGYALTHPTIVDLLRKVQLPFTVNQAAMTAALAAIEDEEFIELSLKNNKQGIIQLREGLTSLNFNYLPSACNFLTIDCKIDGLIIYNFLLDRGIIVRPLHAYKMDQYIRVTVGTKEHNLRFLKAMEEYVNSQK